jgi:hypothetical protein
LSRVLPLFPLGTVLFPGGPLPLRIFEPRYVDMVKRCMREGIGFGVVQLVRGREVGREATATVNIGTEAQIVDFNRLEDGLLGITARGVERFRLLSAWRQADGLNLGEIEDLPAVPRVPVPPEFAMLAEVLERLLPELGPDYAALPTDFADAGWVGARLAELLAMEPFERQALLELDDPVLRLARLQPLVRREDA